MQSSQVIQIHSLAPAKPPEGAPCNGCGVCCATQPCPLGMLLSGQRFGACHALRWKDSTVRYLCGAVEDPAAVARSALPTWLAWLAKPLSFVLPRLARRWIAVGLGCDSSLQPVALTEPFVSDNSSAPLL